MVYYHRSILALVLSASTTATAFTTPSKASSNKLSRSVSDQEKVVEEVVETEKVEEPVYYNILSEEGGPNGAPFMEAQLKAQAGNAVEYPTLNGWYPKEDYALWGLPGAIAPTGFFDPLGFARRGLPLNDAKRLRESEIMHCRVAMVAVVGYLAGEAMDGIGPLGIVGPANDQLQQVPLPVMVLLTAAIASAEHYRARLGWVEPTFRIGSGTLWTLRDSYYPGDLNFDPLGLKPDENYAFQRIQTAELSNGRLAMLAWAGMCAQELVNHRTIGETLDFYGFVFSGGNPYEY